MASTFILRPVCLHVTAPVKYRTTHLLKIFDEFGYIPKSCQSPSWGYPVSSAQTPSRSSTGASLTRSSTEASPKPSIGARKYNQHAHVVDKRKIYTALLSSRISINESQSKSFSTSIGNLEKSKMADNFTANSALENACREEALKIFGSAVTSVLPRQMIDNALKYDEKDNRLIVKDKSYDIEHNIHVVGFGKAVLGMARAVEDIIGEYIVDGILSIPVGIQQCFMDAEKRDLLLQEGTKFTVHEGALHNLPDKAAHQAAMEIHKLATRLKSSDLLIVLISGGGSALLPAPYPSISLDEEMTLTRLLQAGGATIQELNTVRKNIELLKGGGLAMVASPAQVISLILSDVIDDPLDIISSGPTYPDSSTPSQCLDLLNKFGVLAKVPESVLNHLNSRIAKQSPTTMSGSFDNVQNVIVGSNKIAVKAAAEKAEELGYTSYVISSTLQGEASEVGVLFAKLARFISIAMETDKMRPSDKMWAQAELEVIQCGLSKKTLNEISLVVRQAKNEGKSVCLISGGETTVNMRGKGKGGRNQEMVLSAAMAMEEKLSVKDSAERICIQFLSAGTDGIDGPTDAAGAIAGPGFCDVALKECFEPQKYLDNNDSYSILKAVNQGQSLIVTGHTGTNVMDLQILLVKTSAQDI